MYPPSPSPFTGWVFCLLSPFLLVCTRDLLVGVRFTKLLPFDDDDHFGVFRKIQRAEFTMPDHLSPQAKDILNRLLELQPSKRITPTECLAHPWLTAPVPKRQSQRKKTPVVSYDQKGVKRSQQIDEKENQQIKKRKMDVKD